MLHMNCICNLKVENWQRVESRCAIVLCECIKGNANLMKSETFERFLFTLSNSFMCLYPSITHRNKILESLNTHALYRLLYHTCVQFIVGWTVVEHKERAVNIWTKCELVYKLTTKLTVYFVYSPMSLGCRYGRSIHRGFGNWTLVVFYSQLR